MELRGEAVGWREASLHPSPAPAHSALGSGKEARGGLWFALTCWGGPVAVELHSSGGAGQQAGASLAVLRAWGTLSVFLLLQLHLLDDFPDLALCSLEREQQELEVRMGTGPPPQAATASHCSSPSRLFNTAQAIINGCVKGATALPCSCKCSTAGVYSVLLLPLFKSLSFGVPPPTRARLWYMHPGGMQAPAGAPCWHRPHGGAVSQPGCHCAWCSRHTCFQLSQAHL